MSRLRLPLSPAHAGLRLDSVLGGWLPEALGRDLSKSAIRRLVMAGAIWLDGRPVRRPGMLIAAGQRLEAMVDLGRMRDLAGATGGSARPAVGILYEDPWLVAVAKPSGLLAHVSADARRPDLFTEVRRMLAARSRAGSASTPYLGLHHRLDVETSGVVLLATDPAANAGLARAFSEHEVEKIYHAVVARPGVMPRRTWHQSAPLALSGKGRNARMVVVAEGGLTAETSFAVLQSTRAALLVEARPVSGRKHQIRAHLAASGLPILGDVRYGGAATIAGEPVARVMLHASALRLSHPVTGKRLEIDCPYPDDFQTLIERLGASLLGASLDSPQASR